MAGGLPVPVTWKPESDGTPGGKDAGSGRSEYYVCVVLKKRETVALRMLLESCSHFACTTNENPRFFTQTIINEMLSANLSQT